MKRLHRPDLFCWSAFDESRNLDFHSLLWTRAGGNVAIDPLPLSPHDRKHLDELGGVGLVVVTNSDHTRNAEWLARTYDARLAGPRAERDDFPLRCDLWLGDGDEAGAGSARDRARRLEDARRARVRARRHDARHRRSRARARRRSADDAAGARSCATPRPPRVRCNDSPRCPASTPCWSATAGRSSAAPARRCASWRRAWGSVDAWPQAISNAFSLRSRTAARGIWWSEAIAVVLHGHPRFTADLDLVLALDTANLRRALDALAGLGYRPRAPVSLGEFLDPETRARWIEEKGLTVLSLWSAELPATEVDLFASEPSPPFNAAYERAVRADLGDVLVTVAGLSDLIALKRSAGRPQDLEDIRSLEAIDRENGRDE